MVALGPQVDLGSGSLVALLGSVWSVPTAVAHGWGLAHVARLRQVGWWGLGHSWPGLVGLAGVLGGAPVRASRGLPHWCLDQAGWLRLGQVLTPEWVVALVLPLPGFPP